MNKTKGVCYLLTVMILVGLVVIAYNRTTSVGVLSEVTDKGVRLRIRSDRENYHPGDIVTIAVSVENLTSMPIEYILGGIGAPAIHIGLESTPYSDGQGLFEKGNEGRAILPVYTYEVLHAGEVVSRQVVWDQQLLTYPDPIQAPSGTYSIRCVFLVGSYSSQNQRVELSASINIHIQGAWVIITPDEAAEIAREVSEVASWYDDHSGSNLVKYVDGYYYLFLHSEWQKLSPQFTSNGMTIEEIRQNYEPDNNVLMVENTWEVHFHTAYGPTPNEIMVKIEPTTGKVLSFYAGK